MSRGLKVLKKASICEDATAFRDPAAQTVEDFLAHETERCPLFDRCSSGQLLGPDKFNCIPRMGRDVAFYATQGGVPLATEMRDLRKAPIFGPPGKGYIDPYNDPELASVLTDKEEICAKIEDWAKMIMDGTQPAELTDHCDKHAKFMDACRECGVARTQYLDATVVVTPRGVPKRVRADKCRCPVLAVGDFCPVHQS